MFSFILFSLIFPKLPAYRKPKHFFRTTTMNFISDTAWWITAAIAIAATSIPSLLKPLKILPMLLVLAVWIAAVTRMAMIAGPLAALAGGGISLLWGLFLMLFTLLFSGVKLMAKKRYG